MYFFGNLVFLTLEIAGGYLAFHREDLGVVLRGQMTDLYHGGEGEVAVVVHVGRVLRCFNEREQVGVIRSDNWDERGGHGDHRSLLTVGGLWLVSTVYTVRHTRGGRYTRGV